MLDALTTLERGELRSDLDEAASDARAVPRILTVAVLLGDPATRNRAVAVYSSCGFDARLAGSLLWPDLERARGGTRQALERITEAARELQGPPRASAAPAAPERPRVVSRPPSDDEAPPLPADFRIDGKTWPEVMAAGLDPSVMDTRRMFAEAANASKAGLLNEWKAKHVGAWG